MSSRKATVDEARLHGLHTTATKLAVSIGTVRRLIKSGALHATNVSAGKQARWRVDEAEIRRFLKARQMLATIKVNVRASTGKGEAPPPREGTPRSGKASPNESA